MLPIIIAMVMQIYDHTYLSADEYVDWLRTRAYNSSYSDTDAIFRLEKLGVNYELHEE